MRARQFLQFIFGCVFGVVGLHAATAAEADSQDSASVQRSTDCPPAKNNGNGDDAILGGRDNTPSNNGSNGGGDNGSHGGGDTASPSRHVNLGWQSLLPGSIQ